MDFTQLLSLAKKNEHDAKVQLKTSKNPDFEFRTPGKEDKPKRNMTEIQMRLKEHQERLRREEEAKKRKPEPKKIPQPTISKPVASAGLKASAQVKKQLPVSKTPSTTNLAKKPLSVPSSSKALPKNDVKMTSVRPIQSSGKSDQFSAKPTQNGRSSFKLPDKPRNEVKQPLSRPKDKPKLPPPPPGASFQELLKLAAQQAKEPYVENPLPPVGIPPKPTESLRNPFKQPPSSRNVNIPSSSGSKKSRDAVKDRNLPGTSSSVRDNPISSKLSRSAQPEIKKPVSSVNMNGVKKPSGIQNGKSVNKSLGSRFPVENPQKKAPTGSTSNAPGKSSFQAAVNAAAKKIDMDKMKRPVAKPDNPPRKPVTAAPAPKVPPKSAYPDKFNPFKPIERMAPKKRFRDEYEDEEEDEDMDDFIDDTPLDDEYANNYSRHIREIFRYDPRKYVGADADDDDLAGMESNFAQISKEEAISAYIGRKEDEREEELERQELARERERKKRKMM